MFEWSGGTIGCFDCFSCLKLLRSICITPLIDVSDGPSEGLGGHRSVGSLSITHFHKCSSSHCPTKTIQLWKPRLTICFGGERTDGGFVKCHPLWLWFHLVFCV